MHLITNSSADATIESQIQQAVELVGETRIALQKNGSPRVFDALEQLSRLDEQLKDLRRQVAQMGAERGDLLALAGIGKVVNSILQLDDVLLIVMDTIIHLTGAERGFLMLSDQSGELSIQVARNWVQETLEPSEMAFSSTIVNRVVSSGQPVLTTNAQLDPRFDKQESIIAQSLRSILCVPLIAKGDLIGVIYADNRIRSGLFTMRQRSLLSAFADQAAVAIENARLFASVHKTLAEVIELQGLMDNVFTSLPNGVITTDLDDRVTFSSRAAQNILGIQPAQFAGRKIQDLLPDLVSGTSDPLLTVRQNLLSLFGVEIEFENAGRGPVFLRVNLSPLLDAEGNLRGTTLVLEDLTEQKYLEARHRLFERMVSPEVIQEIDATEPELGGQRTEITTLFVDIHDFTCFTENIEPEELVSVLNMYLKVIIEAVLAEKGTVNKLLGDAVMALFNAPISQPDHALRAVRAALRIQSGIRELYNRMPPTYCLSFGVGIDTGEAVLGLIGTQERLEYTAIGDSVNTAKRIQESSGDGQILISLPAYEQVEEHILAREVEPLNAKGKSQPVRIFEVLGPA